MFENHKNLASLTGDGGYDTFFRDFFGLEVLQKVPPPCHAVVKIGIEKFLYQLIYCKEIKLLNE